ncbi:hypothetical protein GOBAR_DD33647 [Gossypium barbadense]|nr:hypothetical protein GOBAR_DD33647 [Gossypium barbadense]
MASMLSSQGMVLATAMAVSGTVILLAFRYQKSFPLPHPSQQVLRSCISSEDVMEPRGDGLQVKNHVRIFSNNSSSKLKKFGGDGGKQGGEMPANRVALYHGILRDRGVQRLAYSY